MVTKICPTCSAKAILFLAWPGEHQEPTQEPNVFTQYRCLQGHYFQTLRIFDGTIYQEYQIGPAYRKSNTGSLLN